jgi:hypothetical protein
MQSRTNGEIGLRPIYDKKTASVIADAIDSDEQAALLCEASQVFEGFTKKDLVNVSIIAEIYGFFDSDTSKRESSHAVDAARMAIDLYQRYIGQIAA